MSANWGDNARFGNAPYKQRTRLYATRQGEQIIVVAMCFHFTESAACHTFKMSLELPRLLCYPHIKKRRVYLVVIKFNRCIIRARQRESDRERERQTETERLLQQLFTFLCMHDMELVFEAISHTS